MGQTRTTRAAGRAAATAALAVALAAVPFAGLPARADEAFVTNQESEDVSVVARGPFGREPLLVQVGFTRFALRHSEAGRIRIRPGVEA